MQARTSPPTPARTTRTRASAASPQVSASQETSVNEVDDGLIGPLLGFKAFGIATLSVTIFAAVGVWGVKAYTGVRNVCVYFDLSYYSRPLR